ncbi:MAG: hypothetical protein O6952_01695, partial [Planctomycetota bacterium]|nr:hypothetical protein [Planctomycetota bacterium]
YLIYLALLEGIRPKLSLVGRTFFAPPEAIFGANEATIEKMGLVPRVLRAMKGVSMTLDVARGVKRKIPAP